MNAIVALNELTITCAVCASSHAESRTHGKTLFLGNQVDYIGITSANNICMTSALVRNTNNAGILHDVMTLKLPTFLLKLIISQNTHNITHFII